MKRLISENCPQTGMSTLMKQITINYGDRFLNDLKHLIFKVPAAISINLNLIPDTFNVLINTLHKDIGKISISNILPITVDT